ncbi:MAG: hypothetical protein EHM28_04395 [Spirochaetaceae bacterium]|nr:MAG: hypothetical protein EHM28_04395 [Spirochaetaceae bacterium]
MKKTVFASLIFLLSAGFLFSQQTDAQAWFSSPRQYKMGLMDGILIGIRYSQEIFALKENRDETDEAILSHYNNALLVIVDEEQSFWIGLVDSFYSKSGNENMPLMDVLLTIIAEKTM